MLANLAPACKTIITNNNDNTNNRIKRNKYHYPGQRIQLSILLLGFPATADELMALHAGSTGVDQLLNTGAESSAVDGRLSSADRQPVGGTGSSIASPEDGDDRPPLPQQQHHAVVVDSRRQQYVVVQVVLRFFFAQRNHAKHRTNRRRLFLRR